MQTRTFTTYDLTIIAIFSAIIAVTSQLSIPMPYGVPMTLQTLVIPIIAIILGTKKGTIATIIYVLIGIMGVPVFANFNSGFGAILGPTGGFIISFPILAFTAGVGYKKKKIIFLLYLVAGAVINYAVGLIVFSFVTGHDYITSFTYCILPYIPTTIIKIILIFIFGGKIKTLLLKQGVKL